MNYSKNPLKIILHDLYNFLGITDHVNCQVIKKSNREGYNFSFIVDLKAWSKFIILPQVSEDRNILNYSSDLMDMDERLSELVTISKDWIFHVSRAIIEKNKCLLYLDRTQFFKTLLYEIQVNQPHYGQFIGLKEIVNLQKDDIHLNNLTDHRLTLIHRVTNNLLKYSKFVNSDQQNANLKFLLTTKSNPKKGDPTVRRIACGVVFNHMHGNVVPTLTQDEYFKKKSLDIELILIHKYGVRVKDEKAFQDLIESLARAHVTVDLIEKKMTSTLNLNLNITGSESSKGASFILYNSARLESMLKKFDEQIRKGYYSKLPDIDSVDFAHLKEEV